MRLWMENNFLLSINEIGETVFYNQTLNIGNVNFSPILDSSKISLQKTAKIIVDKFNINSIEFEFFPFKDEPNSINLGNGNIGIIDNVESDNLYRNSFQIEKENSINVFVNELNLTDINGFVYTIAFELADYKFRKVTSFQDYDKKNIDIDIVTNGFGFFGANCSFRINSNFEIWEATQMTFLTQEEWGYLLALYAFKRNENTKDWGKYLNPNVYSYFKKSIRFILANPQLIFK